jgi:hypothetical protein
MPQEHSWIQSSTKHLIDIGRGVKIAFAEMENRNGKLAGIFQGLPQSAQT